MQLEGEAGPDFVFLDGIYGFLLLFFLFFLWSSCFCVDTREGITILVLDSLVTQAQVISPHLKLWTKFVDRGALIVPVKKPEPCWTALSVYSML